MPGRMRNAADQTGVNVISVTQQALIPICKQGKYIFHLKGRKSRGQQDCQNQKSGSTDLHNSEHYV